MPAASSWVRGQGSTTERTLLLSTYRERTGVTGAGPPEHKTQWANTIAAAESAAATSSTTATAPVHSSFKAQHVPHHHGPRKRKVATSGTWKPGDSQALPIKRAKPARADTKRGKGSNSQPPKTSAKCKEDAEALQIKKEIERRMQDIEDIKRKRKQLEAQRDMKTASTLRKQQEEQDKARNEVASIAQAMETSEKLQQRRQQYEVEHEEELRLEEEQRASREKQIKVEVQQQQVIAHVLKQHQSHYDILQIPQTATSADISKAWKQLSKVVHPDRCKLPRAEEAFIKIKASVDALQSSGR